MCCVLQHSTEMSGFGLLKKLGARRRIPTETNTRVWHLFDATDQIVGRLANRIGLLLQGKHSPLYNTAKDVGDTVVVVNAEKVKFTGNKWEHKLYRHHTLYPGGLKEVPAWRLLEKDPTQILIKAVNGQLPKNQHRRQRIRRLHVYTGPNHPHGAQFQSLVVKRQSPDGATTTLIAQSTLEPLRGQTFIELPAYALPNRAMRPVQSLVPAELPDLTPPHWPKYGAAVPKAASTASTTRAVTTPTS